jgi:hypothetical protein
MDFEITSIRYNTKYEFKLMYLKIAKNIFLIQNLTIKLA